MVRSAVRSGSLVVAVPMLFLPLLLLLVTTNPARAAAPRLITVSGPFLERAVILDDWDRNHALLLGNEASDAKRTDLEGRPYIDLALFWGPDWVDYVNQGRPLEVLRPELANEHGRFYPAMGEQPSLVTFGGSLRVLHVPRNGLDYLTHQGVPVRIEPGSNSVSGSLVTRRLPGTGEPAWPHWLLVPLGATLDGLGLSLWQRRQQRI